ncbi:MAG: Asp-tRNA(Asn)/Glu-tRNA(Gln) amidotransferase subunit GatC [Planctomycetaceae bacterium]|nr:Asp-tRNA(Asn)/Glu-tRNA(Gln) amidotransferase subunit GatC [Planctomycetaceae bacterium]
MPDLTLDVVRKVANLSRLQLTPEEEVRYAKQLSDVLKYVDMLSELDTSNVEPMAHPHEVSDVFRVDEAQPSLPRETALANAPKTDGKYFLVPQILENA